MFQFQQRQNIEAALDNMNPPIDYITLREEVLVGRSDGFVEVCLSLCFSFASLFVVFLDVFRGTKNVETWFVGVSAFAGKESPCGHPRHYTEGFWSFLVVSIRPKSHKNEVFSIFGKVTHSNYQFPMNLNNPMELLAFPAF